MKVQSMKVKISTLSLKNSTRHLTGVIKIIILSLIIITLYTKSTSALTYQDSVDVSFTFDPTLSISLSSNHISIDNLVPGNFAHSNTIAINVSTNNVYGYTLTAKVGEDGGDAGTSASSSLVNSSSGTNFISLSPNDRLTLPNFTSDTWGYTTSSSINNSTTTYTGLLYNTDTTINMTKNHAGDALGRFNGTNTTHFTIGASASTGQLAGDYTNVITFAIVTNVDVPPLCNPNGTTISTISCMQDINESNRASILASMTEDSQYQLVDSRDEKAYWVAKLKDGNVWMTQNLDLLIGGYYNNEPIVLTSENTDLNQYDTNGDGTGTTFTGYTYNNNIITWTPTASAMTGSPATISGTTVTGWNNRSTTPYMAEGDDTYSAQGTRYNSLALCEANGTRTKAQCMHYHVGNYYNWTAAVAMSSTSTYTTDNTVTPNSICPKGWRLPNGITEDNGTKIQSDFNVLLTDYGIAGSADTVGGTSAAKSDWATVGYLQMGLSPLFFARSGSIYNTSLSNFGTYGYYWSSTVGSSDSAYSLGYTATDLYPAYRGDRRSGRSVRCMAR